MTRTAIEKLKGTPHEAFLERQKKWRNALLDAGRDREATAAQALLAGYVKALRNCGIITESERRTLFIYYGTI